jgi:hypothetical protein
MPRKKKLSVELDLAPQDLNGKLKFRVTARLGETILHVDTFDVGIDQHRVRFLNKVAERARHLNVGADVNNLEQQLIHCANDAVLGLGDGDVARARRNTVAPSQVLDAFGITVLGEHDDQSIRCWSENIRKTFLVKSPSNWKEAEVLQCVGTKAADRLWCRTDSEPPDGSFTLLELQRALALTAAEAPRLAVSQILGQGVWSVSQKVLIVDGAYAFLYDGTDFRRVQRPVISGSIIELSAARLWHGSLLTAVREMNSAKANKLLLQLVRLLDFWRWMYEWDARILAALVFATFIQALWRWRPLVSITGPSDSGKSTLMQELLLPVFLRWAICADRSTEAGLRQALGLNSAPILIDEFDKYQHRHRVLELFRTASRGGKVLRGTADQTGLAFGVKHIPWIAAIESGDLWTQDRNRFVRFELQAPAKRGLELPEETELTKLGLAIAAAAIWAATRAVPLAEAIKGTPTNGVHGRVVESMSVAAAMFAVLQHGREATDAQARHSLKQMLARRQHLEIQSEPDHELLLRDILGANILVSIRCERKTVTMDQSVGQLLEQRDRFGSELEAKGVKHVTKRDDHIPCLFIAHDAVLRHLLKGTRWEGSRIDQILLRISGAFRVQHRCAGTRPWGVAIPWPPVTATATPNTTGKTP